MDYGKRLKHIREKLDKTQAEFADLVGTSRSSISQIEIGRHKPTVDLIKSVHEKTGVSYEDMMSDEFAISTSIVSESITPYAIKSEPKHNSQEVPLYNIEAFAGLVPLLDNTRAQHTSEFLSIPHLPKCDGAVFITGDSMYPLLKSGDIVCYKQITKEDIFFGEMYLLGIDMAGDEYISVKFVQKSDLPEHIKLVSQNQHHQDRDVHLDKITAIALIKASIRINSMN